MKIKIVLTIFVVLAGLNSALAQVGIETLEPKTTLHVEGVPATTTTPDGLKAPVLTIAQLDAKIAAYGADQDGAFVYVNDATGGSTTAETCKIISNGYYYYNASSDVWEALGSMRYCVGDFAQGGVVFWVDETGEHGLVAAKQDQSASIRWNAGTNGVTRATGDGPFAGESNTAIIIPAQISFDSSAVTPTATPISYAATLCNQLTINEGGILYDDWYLPSREELNIMYQNRTVINATATANGGGNFVDNFYWSSTEFSANNAYGQNLVSGSQVNGPKSTNVRVRAVRRF